MAKWLADGFVVNNGCDFTHLRDKVLLDGTIYCLGGIEIEVEKTLAILSGKGSTARVKTMYFNYNAKVKNLENILRYESAAGHRRLPHKHSFDTFGDGRETSFTEYDGSPDVPSLSTVIGELRGWYDKNRDRLV